MRFFLTIVAAIALWANAVHAEVRTVTPYDQAVLDIAMHVSTLPGMCVENAGVKACIKTKDEKSLLVVRTEIAHARRIARTTHTCDMEIRFVIGAIQDGPSTDFVCSSEADVRAVSEDMKSHPWFFQNFTEKIIMSLRERLPPRPSPGRHAGLSFLI